MNGKILAVFLLLLVTGTAHGIESITVSSEDYDMNMAVGVSYELRFRVYNQGDGEAKYSIKAMLDPEEHSGELGLDFYFDHGFSEEEFTLAAGENRKIYLTLTPKFDVGDYTVLVVASTVPTEEEIEGSGVRVILTAEKTVIAHFVEKPEEAAISPESAATVKVEEDESEENEFPVSLDNPLVLASIGGVGLLCLLGIIYAIRRR